MQVGCAFRAGLIGALWQHDRLIDIFEHSLDAFVSGGAEDGLRTAATCAEMKPFSLHSIGLTLGSPDARNKPKHLEEIRAVLDVMGADEISDHLAYSVVDGERLHDFMPLWRVEEQLTMLCENIEYVQEQIRARLVLENVACLFDPGGDMTSAELANEVHRRTGCGLLLDISNVLVDDANGYGDAATAFATYDLDAVVGVHLAGGELSDGIMWDAHNHRVAQTDLDWLGQLLPKMPNCRSVIIERDERLQEGRELVDDLEAVHAVVAKVLAAPAPV